MGQTVISRSSPQTETRWSKSFPMDIATGSFWGRTMTSTSGDLPVWRKTELERDSGDSIKFSLSMQIGGETVHGDDNSEGTEESLRYFDCTLILDAEQKSTAAGGKMSQKRMSDDMRSTARKALADFWKRWYDNGCFYHASGARGIGAASKGSLTHRLSYSGGPNALIAPDAHHLVYAGAATSKATLTANDLIDLPLIARLQAMAESMGDSDNDVPAIRPISFQGESDTFVFVMDIFQAKKLKTTTGEGSWLDVEKSAAASVGYGANPFSKALGKYYGVILHTHKRVVRFGDYGAGANVGAARALFLGAQALAVAWGDPSGGKDGSFTWNEINYDDKRKWKVSTDTIVGITKTTYTDNATNTKHDYGVIAVDAARPSA